MKELLDTETGYVAYDGQSGPRKNHNKKIIWHLFRGAFPVLLIGVTLSVLAQTNIPSQTGTYTLSGAGPFILPAPNTITAPGAVGIFGGNTADWNLTIASGAEVNATNGVFLSSQSGGSVLNHAGRIVSGGTGANGGAYGVNLVSGGTINNLSTGVIDSQSDAIFVTAGGTVNNDGTLLASLLTAVYFNDGGTYVGGASSVINSRYGIIVNSGNGLVTNAGNIDGVVNGVVFRNSAVGTLTNQAGGIIASQGDAVVFGAAGSVVDNSGLIRGSSGLTAVYFNAGGTYVGSSTSTLNGGYGVIVNSGIGSVTNAGTISVGHVGTWFRGNAGGVLSNQIGGTITATGAAVSQYGVLVNSSGNVQIDNAGAISGGTGVLFASDGHSLINSGSITGTAGTAISLTGNNNAVTLKQGSSISGAITSTASGNTLTLKDSGALSNNFSGLQRVIVDAGAGQNWTLSGSTMSTNGAGTAALDVQSGTLILDKALTHTGMGGGSTIASGATLRIGTGGTTGSVSGNIVDNGVLAFDRSDDYLYTGIVSGSGSLVQQGSGALVLISDHSYTGITTVANGHLQLGNGGTTGSVAGNIVNNALLTFNHSNDYAYGGIISGSGNLVQQGSGSLVLISDHSYTGITTVANGHLQLGNGGTTGSVAGNIVNNALLTFNRSNDYAYGGIISGSGNLVQQGSGRLVFSQNQTYTGTTDIDAGALILVNNAHLAGGGNVTVASGTTLGGYGGVAGDVLNQGLLAVANTAPGLAGGPDGQFTIGGNLLNDGEILMAGAQPSSVLLINGNYVGNGMLALNTWLAGDGSPTDRLVVRGSTSGTTIVHLNNVGGIGAQTVNGIQVVNVGGQSNGVFQLDNRIVAGAYEYDLYHGGVGANAGDGHWYLRSLALPVPPGSIVIPTPSPRPEPALYVRNQVAGSEMFLHTLHDRLGEPRYADGCEGEGACSRTGWVRIVSHSTSSRSPQGQIDHDTDTSLIHLGGDIAQWQGDGDSRFHVGVMGAYGKSDTSASSNDIRYTNNGLRRKASGTIEGYSLGIYGTWYSDSRKSEGLYLDSWAQYGRYNNTVKGNGLNEEKYDSRGWTVSTEAGYAFSLKDGAERQWILEPQVQLAYNAYREDNHTEANGTRVDGSDANGWITRLGTRLYSRSKQGNGLQPFVEANWWHGSASNSLRFNGQKISDGAPSSRYELKLGVYGNVANGWQLWGHLGGQWGENGYDRLEAMAGMKYVF